MQWRHWPHLHGLVRSLVQHHVFPRALAYDYIGRAFVRTCGVSFGVGHCSLPGMGALQQPKSHPHVRVGSKIAGGTRCHRYLWDVGQLVSAVSIAIGRRNGHYLYRPNVYVTLGTNHFERKIIMEKDVLGSSVGRRCCVGGQTIVFRFSRRRSTTLRRNGTIVGRVDWIVGSNCIGGNQHIGAKITQCTGHGDRFVVDGGVLVDQFSNCFVSFQVKMASFVGPLGVGVVHGWLRIFWPRI